MCCSKKNVSLDDIMAALAGVVLSEQDIPIEGNTLTCLAPKQAEDSTSWRDQQTQ